MLIYFPALAVNNSSVHVFIITFTDDIGWEQNLNWFELNNGTKMVFSAEILLNFTTLFLFITVKLHWNNLYWYLKNKVKNKHFKNLFPKDSMDVKVLHGTINVTWLKWQLSFLGDVTVMLTNILFTHCFRLVNSNLMLFLYFIKGTVLMLER